MILFEPEIRGLAWASLFLESPQVFLKLACARGQTPHNSSQPGLRLESPLGPLQDHGGLRAHR
jgi:hypothetical protein